MSKAKIYTRFGDQGKTRLVDGSCVDKFNPRVEAYGTVDELNSSLGVVITALQMPEQISSLIPSLQKIQNHLFRIGSLLACNEDKVSKTLPQIENSHVLFLENLIDEMSETLPELKNFILPGGHLAATELHVARTICRRSERRTAEILASDTAIGLVLIYLNRLSDFLFVAARWVNHQTKHPDMNWDKTL
ncbi:MAG: cob(I)yrinic acid a,c-diamide adenosyltransferase [Bdellovibrionota bacterium]